MSYLQEPLAREVLGDMGVCVLYTLPPYPPPLLDSTFLELNLKS